MQTLRLHREPSTDEGTPGRLTGEGVDFCTLELPWRDLNGNGIGDPQMSCITPGTYECAWHESPHFGWCYEVTGVKGRSHILIHAANFAGDTPKGWQSQLLGCIALGQRHGVIQNKWGKAQRAVVSSKTSVTKFHELMRTDPFTLVISDFVGSVP